MSRIPQIIRTDGAWALTRLHEDQSVEITYVSASASRVYDLYDKLFANGSRDHSVAFYTFETIKAHTSGQQMLMGFVHLN